MKKYTRSIALALIMLLAFSLAACGNSGSQSSGSSSSSSSSTQSGAPAAATSTPSSTPAANAPGSAAPAVVSPASLPDLIVATGTDASTLDPHLCTDSATEVLNRNIYQNLVRYNEEMKIIPELATDWSVSADGLVWTFNLKNGIKFQDGTPFNAEAVKVNFERILSPDTASPRRSVLEMIAEVEAKDDATVLITTAYPCGSFLQQLCHPAGGIASPKAIGEYGLDLGRNPCGTGPLMLKEWRPAERLVFDAYADYHDGAPQFNSITFNIVPDDSVRAMLIEAGECDVALRLPVNEVKRLRGTSNLVITESATIMTMYIALHNQNGALKDQRIREALNLAVDMDSIVKNVVSDFSEVADSVISPYTWGYAPIGAYPYDPERARALLKDAGYENNYEFTLWTPVGRYLMDLQVAEAIQGQLANVGVKMNIQQWEFQALMDEVKKGEFDAVLLGWSPSTGDADQGMFPVFHSTQFPPGSNRAHYANAEVDELLDGAKREVDAGKRAQMYADAQRIIMEEAGWLLLYYPKQALTTTDKVSGIELLPTEHMLFAKTIKTP
ncbi:MAG: glutathione ABC transporter substrate-binding protein [Clostridiales bacterium]|nr:glutathione ABC transporter substrate-binding protein [Clostridiales bacterium]